jgi:DNA polymerase (family 10)
MSAPTFQHRAAHLNRQVATRFDEVAQILEEQGANPFRVRAYRRAAGTLRELPRPVSQVLEEGGLAALEALPHVGESLARSIRDLVLTGRLPMLQRMRGEADPVALFLTVPGIGRKTAERLHHDLGLESLEDLEAAAHDGRLAALPGLGPKRLAGVRESLAQRLSRVRRPGQAPAESPAAFELLDVDREYRVRAREGRLPRIAPRRLNPTREAWLPILHTERGGRHYTALYSNTPRAHRLGATRDWVVIHLESPWEGQWTVITARHGPLAGQRIVRGREAECARLYGARRVVVTRSREAPELEDVPEPRGRLPASPAGGPRRGEGSAAEPAQSPGR